MSDPIQVYVGSLDLTVSWKFSAKTISMPTLSKIQDFIYLKTEISSRFRNFAFNIFLSPVNFMFELGSLVTPLLLCLYN